MVYVPHASSSSGYPSRSCGGCGCCLVDFLPMVGGALAGIPTVLFAATHSLTAGIVMAAVFVDLPATGKPRTEPADHEQDRERQTRWWSCCRSCSGPRWKAGRRDVRRIGGLAALDPLSGRASGDFPGSAGPTAADDGSSASTSLSAYSLCDIGRSQYRTRDSHRLCRPEKQPAGLYVIKR